MPRGGGIMTKSFLVAALVLAFSSVALAEANDAPYTEGSRWELTFVRAKYGFADDYLKGLAGTWKKTMDEAKKQGLVVSYKVLSAAANGKEDWDLLLMVEFKNMAAFDGLDAKMRALETKIIGNEDAQRNLMVKRLEIREILGSKLATEINLK
jgi:hypothetical protein